LKRFVLDCSVSAAWCLRDETSDRAREYLALLEDGEAFVPALWTVEMTNVLLMAERRKRITKEDAALALGLLERLPIVVTDAATGSMPRLYEIAARHRLSAYDASYLDLAATRRFPLATLDQGLRTAARAAGVPLV
jgi:predicted nucleic acid-binding protein